MANEEGGWLLIGCDDLHDGAMLAARLRGDGHSVIGLVVRPDALPLLVREDDRPMPPRQTRRPAGRRGS